MSNIDWVFDGTGPEPAQTLTLDLDPTVDRDRHTLADRIRICRAALGTHAERSAWPLALKGGRLADADTGRVLTRHEVAALLSRAVAFGKAVGGSPDRLRPIDPPGNLVSAVFSHPPPNLPEVGDHEDVRLNELWTGFVIGWWSAWENQPVGVGKLVSMPGLDALAPVLGQDQHGRRVALGRILGAREGVPVNIGPPTVPEPLTVAPLLVGMERSGARTYKLDRQLEPEPVPVPTPA